MIQDIVCDLRDRGSRAGEFLFAILLVAALIGALVLKVHSAKLDTYHQEQDLQRIQATLEFDTDIVVSRLQQEETHRFQAEAVK